LDRLSSIAWSLQRLVTMHDLSQARCAGAARKAAACTLLPPELTRVRPHAAAGPHPPELARLLMYQLYICRSYRAAREMQVIESVEIGLINVGRRDTAGLYSAAHTRAGGQGPWRVSACDQRRRATRQT
jgi:hypothetical protein